MQGEHHRRQRKLLNPVFSINHMRHMTPIFYHVVHRVRLLYMTVKSTLKHLLPQLRDVINMQIAEEPAEINMLEWMSRTALELVGQAGLGYSFDPLTTNMRNAFGEALKELQYVSFYRPVVRIETYCFRQTYPAGTPPLSSVDSILSTVSTPNASQTLFQILALRKPAQISRHCGRHGPAVQGDIPEQESCTREGRRSRRTANRRRQGHHEYPQ